MCQVISSNNKIKLDNSPLADPVYVASVNKLEMIWQMSQRT